MEVSLPTSRLIDEMKINAYINERTIYLTDDEITEEVEFVVNRMFERIVDKDRKANIQPKDAEPIILKVSTYGGDVFATLSIISQVEYLKEIGYKIIGIAYGKVMSGGFKVLISCSERKCQRHTRFLYHQVQSYELGHTSVEQSRRKLKDLEELWKRASEIILKYTKISKEKLDEITNNDLDVCMWPEEALELGVVDTII